MFKSTIASNIILIILKDYPVHQPKMVKEVTLDMAGNMNLIIKRVFDEPHG